MARRLQIYRRNVRDFNNLLPEQDTTFKRIAVSLAGLILGVPELEIWRTFPKVDSPEMPWGNDSPQKLEQELTEILNESAASSRPSQN